MGIRMLLEHFRRIDEETQGSITYRVGSFRSDRTGKERALIVDLSHQNRTQANYLSGLNAMINKWDCTYVILYLNSVTRSLLPSLPTSECILIDARATPIDELGYAGFPLLHQDLDDDGRGLICFFPELRRTMYEADVMD